MNGQHLIITVVNLQLSQVIQDFLQLISSIFESKLPKITGKPVPLRSQAYLEFFVLSCSRQLLRVWLSLLYPLPSGICTQR